MFNSLDEETTPAKKNGDANRSQCCYCTDNRCRQRYHDDDGSAPTISRSENFADLFFWAVDFDNLLPCGKFKTAGIVRN
jgi:hypothetical protein